MSARLSVFIDSGNSRVKLGWLNAFEPVESVESIGSAGPLMPRMPMVPVEQTAAFDKADVQGIQAWLAALPAAASHHALGVNVAGAEQAARLTGLFATAGMTLSWRTASKQAGDLINGYDQPAQLGPDRWAAMLGAQTHAKTHTRPLIMASFGTATTIDTVGPDGRFIGGVILPGPALMRRSLFNDTADLPLADSPVSLFPTHTHAAIASGVAAAQAGALLRQWLAARAQFDTPPTLFVAGGGWHEVASEVHRLLNQAAHGGQGDPTYLSHPVIDGLAALAEQTRTGES